MKCPLFHYNKCFINHVSVGCIYDMTGHCCIYGIIKRNLEVNNVNRSDTDSSHNNNTAVAN